MFILVRQTNCSFLTFVLHFTRLAVFAYANLRGGSEVQNESFLTFVLHFTRLAVNLYQNKIYTYETLTFGQWRP